MITYIELKETFRNRRFILFTLISPVMWYIFMVNIAKSAGFFTHRYSSIWFVASCVMGIMGNSVVTFGKTINRSQNFYFLQAKTSRYGIKNWVLDQMMIQLILNVLIALTVTICGVVMQTIQVDINFIFEALLCQILGVYFCLIGFAMGIVADNKVLDALSFPIMMVWALLIIPFDTWTTVRFVTIISAVQKLFPGYYLFTIIQHLIDSSSLGYSVLRFVATIVMTAVPIGVFTYLHIRRMTS